MSKTLPFAREIAAATAVDFAATLDHGFPRLPQAFEMPDGGTLVFTDGSGTSRTFSDLPAGYRGVAEMRAISADTTGKVRVFSSALHAAAPAVPSSIGPSQLAGAADNTDGLAATFAFKVAFTAGTTGSADDVTVLEDAPFAFIILDVIVVVSTAKAANTVTLRTAVEAGGSALSSAISVASTGRVRDGSTTVATVTAGGDVYLRRSDRDCAGTVILICAKS